MRSRLRARCGHCVEAWYFFVVPGVAALLPWRWGWRWLRYWSRHEGGPFSESARAAVAVAVDHVPIADREKFVHNSGLIVLMDRCDLFLSLFHRRRSWSPWHVELVGAWPQRGPFVAAGLHFGAGYWLHHFLARAGHDCTTVSIRFEREEYLDHPMLYWYGRLRYRDMERVSGRPIAYRPGVKPVLRQTLAQGATILSLVDMPPHLAPREQYPVRFLDLDLSFPEGMLALAREAGAPVVPFWIEFDERLYKRRFCIGEPLDPHDPGTVLQTLATILDRQIRRVPEAWMFWPLLPRWIADAAPLHAAADRQTL